ncbi:MAG: DNA repair protein RecO [Candidatus Poribacteria bacterium]
MPVQTTEAIVIKSQSLGEVDKIICFYTSDFGKVRAVAKGIKRPKNRYGGSLDLLNYGALVFFFRPHKDLQIINSFDILDSFNTLKDDLTKTAYAFYIAELLDTTGAEGKVNNAAFQLTLQALSSMNDINHPELLVHAYSLQLLKLMGFRPQLQTCVGCSGDISGNNPLTPFIKRETFRFSPMLGGMLCSKCFYKDASALSISPGAYELMKRMQTIDLALVKRFSASDTVKHELKKNLSKFISFQLERQFKSLEFIDNIS